MEAKFIDTKRGQVVSDMDNQKMSRSLSEQITAETLQKISSNEEYDEKEMLCVAEYLVNLYEYDFKTQFGLLTTKESSNGEVFNKLQNLNIREQSFFIIFNKNIKHWVCVSITFLYNTVVVLYKDSLGAQIPHNLREAVCDCLKNEKIRFESHQGTEQGVESSSGPICLRNLQVLLKGLKSDFIKVPLIEKFQKVRFCSQYGVHNVKREFRLWLQKYLLSTLEKAASELVAEENYGNFCKRLSVFLDSNTRVLKETYVLSSTYTSMLKAQAKRQDQDPKFEMDKEDMRSMKSARDRFYRNSEVQRSFKFNKNDFIDLDGGNRIYNLEIQEKYPKQMQKLTKIFAVLAQAEMNEELEKALEKICQMLDLDYEKIRIFFEQRASRRVDLMRNDYLLSNESKSTIKQVEAAKIKSKKTTSEAECVDKNIKNCDQVLSELVLDVQNPDTLNASEEEEIESEKIRDKLQRVQVHYAVWEKRGIQEITMFANACKAEEKIFDDDQLCEAIAVLDRANELITGDHRLRIPQILSILVFFSSSTSCRGKLCQIESGEGKTVIVSLLATLSILQGEKAVDVITSNAILAQEGVDSRKLFYSMFSISVATNVADKIYAHGPRKCYLADVVYGGISDFQFDYLRDTAEGLGTLSSRQFGRVILDEVDNMLVDNGRHIAKISTPYPGMEYLKYIYLKIWNELLTAESELIEDFQEKLNEFSGIKNVEEIAITEFIQIFDSSMIGRLEERIKVKLKDLDFKFVPTHCLKYAETMIPKWICNAIRARYFFRENEQYSIKQSNSEYAIIPVDYSNTGVTLKNTVWSCGLHQFIQIKHNLRITSETLTSSSISSYAYIGKYGNKIFGLTGTLGSKAEQDLLSSIYNIDYARVPTYKTKRFKELNGVVVPDEQWSFEVALMTIGMIRFTNRAVLIICKTISDLLILEKHFKTMKILSWDYQIQVKKFQDEDTIDVIHEIVKPGDVIIATNIAGRGADFKTSRDLENNGGLHVCVGFCPDNERVKEQAFFRTSRQGNQGTAQLVIRESEVRKLNIDTINLHNVDFEQVKKSINIIERERLSDIKRSKLDVLRYEDALFTLFSDLCQDLKNSNVISWGHSYLMKDLKEFWAFWLEDQSFEGKEYSLKEASFIFYKFKFHEKTRRIIDGAISQNPYYGVLQADFFIKNDEVEKAKATLINAICLSKNIKVMYPAFLMLFDLTLEEKGTLLYRFKHVLSMVFTDDTFDDEKSTNFASEILEFLTIAHTGLNEEIDFMKKQYFDIEHNDFKRVIIKHERGKENLLIKNLAAKLTCLKAYRSNLEIILEALDRNDTHSIAINKRMTDYFRIFTPDTKEEKQIKDLITEPELIECGSRGLKIIYSVKKLALIPNDAISKATSEILGAMTFIARASAFPPLNYAVANIVSVMVGEAIALIVLNLFKDTSNFDDSLKKLEYLKGKTLNYIISLLVTSTFNMNVCIKIFLRMIRAYRDSYYLLEHSTDDIRLLKSINSSKISKDMKYFERIGEHESCNWAKKIYVPKYLAESFFESSISKTIIASLVEFVIDRDLDNINVQNGNIVNGKWENSKKINLKQFFHVAKDCQAITKIQSYLTSIAPEKCGGSYEEVRNQFLNSGNYLIVNLVPTEVCYKDTQYSTIGLSDMPSIIMLERDYQALKKLRYDDVCKDSKTKYTEENRDRVKYYQNQKKLLENDEFWVALKNEIAEILAIAKFYQLNGMEFLNYEIPIIQMLQYCKSTVVNGLPEQREGHFINQEQYNALFAFFKFRQEIF